MHLFYFSSLSPAMMTCTIANQPLWQSWQTVGRSSWRTATVTQGNKKVPKELNRIQLGSLLS